MLELYQADSTALLCTLATTPTASPAQLTCYFSRHMQLFQGTHEWTKQLRRWLEPIYGFRAEKMTAATESSPSHSVAIKKPDAVLDIPLGILNTDPLARMRKKKKVYPHQVNAKEKKKKKIHGIQASQRPSSAASAGAARRCTVRHRCGRPAADLLHHHLCLRRRQWVLHHRRVLRLGLLSQRIHVHQRRQRVLPSDRRY